PGSVDGSGAVPLVLVPLAAVVVVARHVPLRPGRDRVPLPRARPPPVRPGVRAVRVVDARVVRAPAPGVGPVLVRVPGAGLVAGEPGVRAGVEDEVVPAPAV